MNTDTNILFCTVDSLRKDAVTQQTMPYTAHLAETGIWFSEMYSTAPATAASFTALMASRYYSDVEGIGLPDSGFTTFAEALPEKFATVGHSTNKFTSSYYNYDRGFDDFDSPTDSLKFLIRRRLDEDSRLFRFLEWGYHHWLEVTASQGQQHSWWNEPAEDVNARIQDAVSDEERWMAWAHYMDPHHPLEPPEDYLPVNVENRGEAQSLTRTLPGRVPDGREEDLERVRSLYGAECRYWDDEFRKLHESLGEDTLVVVVGDHGELLGEHDRYGHPHEMWRELTNVPCLIYHPDLEAQTIDSLQSTLDLPPTLLSLVNQPIPASMRGEPIDLGDPEPRARAYGTIETPEHVGMVRTSEWTWMRHESRRSTQENHGELLFKSGRESKVAAGQRWKNRASRVREELAAAFAAEVDSGTVAIGHRMENEQVKQHMADLGYLDQQ